MKNTLSRSTDRSVAEIRQAVAELLATGDGDDALECLEAELQLRADRMSTITNAVQVRGAMDMDADEAKRWTAIKAERDQLAALEAVTRNRFELDAYAAHQRTVDMISAHQTRQRQLSQEFEGGATTRNVRVGREPLTYSEHDRDGGQRFIIDAYMAEKMHDAAAAERIQRHQAEMAVELRAAGTSAFTTGLVVPQFLSSLYAPAAHAGRPYLDAIGTTPLPDDGMTVNVARVTTAAAVAAQASENSTVSNQDMAATLLTVNVCTYAGYVTVSRQAIERGTGVDTIVMRDLIVGYHSAVDAAAINGDGTDGTHKGVLNVSGINAVTFTSGSPTGALLVPKFADAVQRVNTSRFLPANLCLMHPRRWGWLLSQVDSSGRPLVVPNASYGSMNVAGMGEGLGNAGAGVVGTFQGVPVVLDANIPTNLGGGTNEDRIIICQVSDTVLWEQPSSPVALRFEEPNGTSLGINIVVYGYSAFTAGRYPTGISVISGTGLATPSF